MNAINPGLGAARCLSNPCAEAVDAVPMTLDGGQETPAAPKPARKSVGARAPMKKTTKEKK